MISFSMSDDQKMLHDLAHEFAENEIFPVSAEYDQRNEFAWPPHVRAVPRV